MESRRQTTTICARLKRPRAFCGSEDIDFVMCTHLHVDPRRGWEYEGSKGGPAGSGPFPRARYVFRQGRLCKDYWARAGTQRPEVTAVRRDRRLLPGGFRSQGGGGNTLRDDFAIGGIQFAAFLPTPGHYARPCRLRGRAGGKDITAVFLRRTYAIRRLQTRGYPELSLKIRLLIRALAATAPAA